MEDSSSGLVNRQLVYQPNFSGVNPMICFIGEKNASAMPSFSLSSHHETMPTSNSSQSSGLTTLVHISRDDNNKNGSSPSGTNIDDNTATVTFPPTTSIVEIPVDQISHVVALPALVQGTNTLIHSSTPTAPRSTVHRSRHTSLPKLCSTAGSTVSKNPSFDVLSRPWPVEPGLKSQPNHQKIQQSSKCSKPSRMDYILTCYANVLVTADNRGWRECGAHVVLDSDDEDGMRLYVQLFGETKYFYRANQVMQPGSTNRFTHAMMWRGGRDWSLEFTDRNQWFIFKQMYEECYNRNMRAASVKNIPTPGVRMVEDVDMESSRQPFVRGPGYVRQVGSEVDAALDPSTVMYDMDSEDEEWVLDFNGESELTEDLFERVIDKCEKLAYMNQCKEFSAEQIEKLMGDVGPKEIVKKVCGYWHAKREKKRMPLIRQLQPPLWKHYQKQLEEWESSASKILGAPHSALGRGSLAAKPSMFAFCLRPGVLKLKQQRSHKKLLLSSRSSGGSHKSGRRLSAPTTRGHVALASRVNHLNRTGVSISPFFDDHQTVQPLSHNLTPLMGKRANPASADMSERSNPTRLPSDNLRFLKEDREEFKLRDASNYAVHLAIMARLKREKAELLMQKADLALYKARVAVMIADAIKSSEGTSGDS